MSSFTSTVLQPKDDNPGQGPITSQDTTEPAGLVAAGDFQTFTQLLYDNNVTEVSIYSITFGQSVDSETPERLQPAPAESETDDIVHVTHQVFSKILPKSVQVPKAAGPPSRRYGRLSPGNG